MPSFAALAERSIAANMGSRDARRPACLGQLSFNPLHPTPSTHAPAHCDPTHYSLTSADSSWLIPGFAALDLPVTSPTHPDELRARAAPRRTLARIILARA